MRRKMSTEESPSKKQRLADLVEPITDLSVDPVPNEMQNEVIADPTANPISDSIADPMANPIANPDPNELQDEASNQLPDISAADTQPSIFQLTIDCFDEIFEYLSLDDLYSVGQTCKRLQKIAGVYFKQNFPAAAKCMPSKEICLYSHRQNKTTEIPAFVEFIKHVEIYYSNVDVVHQRWLIPIVQLGIQRHYMVTFDQLRAIESGAKTSSITHISFVKSDFEKLEIQNIRNILAKVEVIDMQRCYLRGDLYQKLLEYCPNLKRLNINGSYIKVDVRPFVDAPNQWLCRQYPLLEHFKLVLQEDCIVDELKEFLELNPNLRSFSTDSQRLFDVCDQLYESSSKLDVFKVKNDDMIDFTTTCNIIKKLHAQGFYNRLHIEVDECSDECSIGLASLPNLEKLCIKKFMGVHRLSTLIALKELAILKNVNTVDMDILANLLRGLQRVFLFGASYADILPFVKCSADLKKIKVYPKDEASFKDGILNLHALNKERAKLPGARKVMIYVPDKMFMKTKWEIKDGNVDLDFIEMQRYDLWSWGMNE